MTLRLPQGLFGGSVSVNRPSALETEIMLETAASLGRAGRKVELAVAALQAAHRADPQRGGLVQAAAAAVHGYLIQRELCGLVDHAGALADYGVPAEVVAKIGAA